MLFKCIPLSYKHKCIFGDTAMMICLCKFISMFLWIFLEPVCVSLFERVVDYFNFLLSQPNSTQFWLRLKFCLQVKTSLNGKKNRLIYWTSVKFSTTLFSHKSFLHSVIEVYACAHHKSTMFVCRQRVWGGRWGSSQAMIKDADPNISALNLWNGTQRSAAATPTLKGKEGVK